MVAGCLPNFQSAQSNIGEVDGDDSLVETPVILGLIGLVIAGIGNIVPAVTGAVGRQEATASHTGIAIAVTFGFALGQLVLAHLLFGDVVGHQPFGRALGTQLSQVPVGRILSDVILFQHIDQLGKRRCRPNALLIFDALVPLPHDLLNDHSKVFLGLRIADLVQIHKDGNERSLTVGSHEGNHLILDSLNTLLYFFTDTLFDQI